MTVSGYTRRQALTAAAGLAATGVLPRRSLAATPPSGPAPDADKITGKLVATAEAKGVELSGLTLAEMQAEEPRITADVFSVLTVEASVASRSSFGGTAPANVAAQAARWLAALA